MPASLCFDRTAFIVMAAQAALTEVGSEVEAYARRYVTAHAIALVKSAMPLAQNSWTR